MNKKNSKIELNTVFKRACHMFLFPIFSIYILYSPLKH